MRRSEEVRDDEQTVRRLAARGLSFEHRARATALEEFIADAPEVAAYTLVVLLELAERNGLLGRSERRAASGAAEASDTERRET